MCDVKSRSDSEALMATTSVTRNRPPWPKNLSCVAAQRPEVPFRFNVEFDVFEEEKNFNTNVHAQICILRFRFSIGYLSFIIKNILEQRSLQEKFNNLVNGAGLGLKTCYLGWPSATAQAVWPFLVWWPSSWSDPSNVSAPALMRTTQTVLVWPN